MVDWRKDGSRCWGHELYLRGGLSQNLRRNDECSYPWLKYQWVSWSNWWGPLRQTRGQHFIWLSISGGGRGKISELLFHYPLFSRSGLKSVLLWWFSARLWDLSDLSYTLLLSKCCKRCWSGEGASISVLHWDCPINPKQNQSFRSPRFWKGRSLWVHRLDFSSARGLSGEHWP